MDLKQTIITSIQEFKNGIPASELWKIAPTDVDVGVFKKALSELLHEGAIEVDSDHKIIVKKFN